MESKRSYCRICVTYSGIRAQLDDTGRLISVGGDSEVEADPRRVGSSTAALLSVSYDYGPISGAARQSAIPVRLRRRAQAVT